MIQFHLPLYMILSIVAGTLLPLLVGLVTSKVTDPGLQATYLAGLSVLTPLVAEIADALQNHKPYDLGAALLTALATFVTAVGTHYGFWKPKGVADVVQSVFVSPDRPGGLLGNDKNAPAPVTPSPAPVPVAPVAPAPDPVTPPVPPAA